MRCTLLHTTLAVFVSVMAVAAPVAAEEPSVRTVSPFSNRELERFVREADARANAARPARTALAQSGRGRDSILNGGLIGAALGGVGGSFLLVAASGGSDDVPGAMLKVSPMTAGFGFLIGAFIDATL